MTTRAPHRTPCITHMPYSAIAQKGNVNTCAKLSYRKRVEIAVPSPKMKIEYFYTIQKHVNREIIGWIGVIVARTTFSTYKRGKLESM